MAAYAAVTSLMGTIHLISQSNLDLLEEVATEMAAYAAVTSLRQDEVESHIQRESVKTLPKMLQRATEIFHLPTSQESLFKTFQRAGMGGIGKSTFANKMFYDPPILSFFDVRGWITVSKDYSLRKMLLCLLQDAIGVKEELDNVSDGDLADRLQKSLKGRRYLIVVDNIWSTYPKDPFPMRFLEPEESWKLFYQKAFDKKPFPIEFENLAKEVVSNCKGLPLMISVVAGTLSSKRTLDEWTNVAQSVSSLVNLDDYQRCSGVLALSYNHLPSHLKACFLYFGVFPKD
ncbi:hypothetical protein KY284_032234 [Solanum tuberosum]|nr:hypothetical protein KY284_032234 [Solanum tuberosum]